MDTIDDAQIVADHFLSVAIENARSKDRAFLPKGKCYYCDSKVADKNVFCDIDCLEDHEKMERKKQHMPE